MSSLAKGKPLPDFLIRQKMIISSVDQVISSDDQNDDGKLGLPRECSNWLNLTIWMTCNAPPAPNLGRAGFRLPGYCCALASCIFEICLQALCVRVVLR